jgi:hypothetical protein
MLSLEDMMKKVAAMLLMLLSLLLLLVAAGCGANPTGSLVNSSPNFGGLLSATAASPTEVLLTWEAATDNDTNASQISYLIFYSLASDAVWSEGVKATVVNTTETTITGLSPATIYTFGVRAQDTNHNRESNTTVESVSMGGNWSSYFMLTEGNQWDYNVILSTTYSLEVKIIGPNENVPGTSTAAATSISTWYGNSTYSETEYLHLTATALTGYGTKDASSNPAFVYARLPIEIKDSWTAGQRKGVSLFGKVEKTEKLTTSLSAEAIPAIKIVYSDSEDRPYLYLWFAKDYGIIKKYQAKLGGDGPIGHEQYFAEKVSF